MLRRTTSRSAATRPRFVQNCHLRASGGGAWDKMYLKLPSFFSVAALIGIAACSAERPQVTACGHDYAAPRVSQSEFDPLLEAARNASMAVSIEDAQESMADSIRQVTREVEGPVIIEILALSAGGQFGAFGAGFRSA